MSRCVLHHSLKIVLVMALTGVCGTAGAQTSDPLAETGNKVRGVIQAVDEAVLSSELTAKVIELPFREGQSFKKGETIIGFDCARYNSELDGAKAEYRSASLTVKNNLKLKKYGAVGKYDLDLSRAKADQARAQVAALTVVNTQCNIKAPFSGRVVETLIKAHEIPASNQPLVKIINDSELEIALIVPSNWLGSLKPGSRFTFVVDETGERHGVEVARIGAAVDPVSQTVKVIGRFDNSDASVLAGMSGTAEFDMPGDQ